MLSTLAHNSTEAPLKPSRRARQTGRLTDLLLSKAAAIMLASAALGLGVITFGLLSARPNALHPSRYLGFVLANLAVLLLLVSVLAARITRVVVERRRGAAGARLHVRLVLLFSVVAAVPSIVVSAFAFAFFHWGIQTWFNDRVRTALDESLQTSRGYLQEHRLNIRADAIGMANQLVPLIWTVAVDPTGFANTLARQATLRGLTEAVVFDPDTGQIEASASPLMGYGIDYASRAEIDLAHTGAVAVLGAADSREVRAVVEISATPDLMLMIGRPVDPDILDHMVRNERAVADYESLDRNRYRLEAMFILIFALVTLLVLSAAILIGLMLANQIARPLGGLIRAAERVRAGDLTTRVPEVRADDELASLARAFNRMTGQLSAQRAELLDAYSQIDARRRFTETVLSGVSAGVIGLDRDGRIELPNRAASEWLGCDLRDSMGKALIEIAPEFAPLLRAARDAPNRSAARDIEIGPDHAKRCLLARIGPEGEGGQEGGWVVTFDDVTALQSAQRKAAWADVARRIAHEIKNPLTPIQLAAERLKRRFSREITSDPATFIQCADTIVRHVEDIGRMVDEFSAFARMPHPVIAPEDIGRIARNTLALHRNARPDIVWTFHCPDSGPIAPCDRRLIGQALTNLLQNAADSVAMREGARWIGVSVRVVGEGVEILVEDDGVGLPAERDRLTEPYVTNKPKGTGLGLAIVKKIMEDHGGALVLEDRAPPPGAAVRVVLGEGDLIRS